MTAHIALPSIVGDNTPASLSRKVSTNLLRSKLGFNGVIVTDCLEMDAVAATYGTEKAAVMALRAGADVAMICHRYDRQVGAIKAVYGAIKAQEISPEELVESGRRISAMKDGFAGTWDGVTNGDLDIARLATLLKTNAELSTNVYADSLAWFDTRYTSPVISAQSSVIVFVPQIQSINPAVDDLKALSTAGDASRKESTLDGYRALESEISNRVKACDLFVYHPEDADLSDINFVLVKAFTSTDKVVFVTRNADRASWQLKYLRKIISSLEMFKPLNSPPIEDRILLISSCGPYDLACASTNGIDLPCLCTFEFTKPAMESAVRAIFGEARVVGTLPVKVD